MSFLLGFFVGQSTATGGHPTANQALADFWRFFHGPIGMFCVVAGAAMAMYLGRVIYRNVTLSRRT
ncbi:hypothetical protein [Burkholderia sp. MBR-1]|uniref:hypothetical protein n=1 Tax=Burkholderia sp. MBR-1 TaxID=2732364 RepID=UPI0015EFB468|nr:hypothetical protein [Burkholderia sp. MBR-1]QMI49817.1 hypothetical protein MBR110_30575 [Burkholderia sp. MBR-1]